MLSSFPFSFSCKKTFVCDSGLDRWVYFCTQRSSAFKPPACTLAVGWSRGVGLKKPSLPSFRCFQYKELVLISLSTTAWAMTLAGCSLWESPASPPWARCNTLLPPSQLPVPSLLVCESTGPFCIPSVLYIIPLPTSPSCPFRGKKKKKHPLTPRNLVFCSNNDKFYL